MTKPALKPQEEITTKKDEAPAIRLEQKITSCYVSNDSSSKKKSNSDCANCKDFERNQSEVIALTEDIKRPDMLYGNTYKIKAPTEEHALYVTVNDYLLEDGTRRPFELFLNSKNVKHFQWVLAMTRIISAVFRKGGDATFLVDELKQVFDPNGGWHMKGGGWCPSLVAMIGMKLEEHFLMTGLLRAEELDEHQKAFLAKKRDEFEAKQNKGSTPTQSADAGKSDFPDGAQLCIKCNTKAMIQMDGCMTCLNCGDSKCQ